MGKLSEGEFNSSKYLKMKFSIVVSKVDIISLSYSFSFFSSFHHLIFFARLTLFFIFIFLHVGLGWWESFVLFSFADADAEGVFVFN